MGVVFFGNKRFSFILWYITPYFIGHLCRCVGNTWWVSTIVFRFDLLGLTGTFLSDPTSYKLGCGIFESFSNSWKKNILFLFIIFNVKKILQKNIYIFFCLLSSHIHSDTIHNHWDTHESSATLSQKDIWAFWHNMSTLEVHFYQEASHPTLLITLWN